MGGITRYFTARNLMAPDEQRRPGRSRSVPLPITGRRLSTSRVPIAAAAFSLNQQAPDARRGSNEPMPLADAVQHSLQRPKRVHVRSPLVSGVATKRNEHSMSSGLAFARRCASLTLGAARRVVRTPRAAFGLGDSPGSAEESALRIGLREDPGTTSRAKFRPCTVVAVRRVSSQQAPNQQLRVVRRHAQKKTAGSVMDVADRQRPFIRSLQCR